MSNYRKMVQDMDDSQKLELITMLIESVKPIQTRSVFDMPLEEDFPDMDKELYTAEEAPSRLPASFGRRRVMTIATILRLLPTRHPTQAVAGIPLAAATITALTPAWVATTIKPVNS